MPNSLLKAYGLAPFFTAQASRTERMRRWTRWLVNPRAKLALCILTVCTAYYLGAVAAKTFRFPSSHLSLIWPPTAILLATLLIAQKRHRWIFLLAAAPVHILVQLQDAVPFFGVVSQLLGNFGQAILAAAIVHRLAGEPPHLNSCRGMVAFILGAAILSPLVVSSLAAYLYVVSGWEENYAYAVKARVFSNVLSTLAIVPAIVFGARALAQNRSMELRRMVEAGLLGCAFVILAVTVFDGKFSVPISLYAPVPLLLWAAVRFGVGGLSLSVLATAYLAFLQANDGSGPFIAGSPEQNILSMQLFLIVISIPLMLLAAAIEERRSKERDLSESEARYRALVTASADAVWRTNEKGDHFTAASGWEHLTGQTEGQMRDFGWLEVVHPEDREQTRTLWQQAVNAMRVYENELRIRTASGAYRHFHSYAVPIIDASGAVQEWVGANSDITDRKRAESRVKAQYEVSRILSEARSVAEAAPRLLEAMCDCFDYEYGELWSADVERNLLSCIETWHLPCAEFAEFASQSRQFISSQGTGLPWRVWQKGMPFWISELSVDDTFARASIASKAGLRSGFAFPILEKEYAVGVMAFFGRESRTPDQELLQVVTSIGSQIGQFAIRKRAEAALRESEERLARTEEFSLVMVTHTDLQGRWLKVPPTLCDLLGYAEEELLGRRFHELIHPDDLEINLRERTRLLGGEVKSFDMETRYIRKDGAIVWVYVNVSVVMDAKGAPFQCLSYIRDITQRKQAEVLRAGQSRMLEMIATSAPLKKVLTSLARFIESQSNGIFCSVRLLDQDGIHMRYGAAPSLPESYTQLTNGIAIGPKAGSCGTAMYRGEPVVVQDILDDPLWDDYRELAVCNGLRACWSYPILSSQGKTLGSFAMYSSEPRSPTTADTELINLAVHIAGIGIERERDQEALRNSEERLRLALEAGRMGVWDWDKTANVLRWSKENFSIFGLEPFSVEPEYRIWSERVHPEDRADVDAAMKSAIAERKEFEREYRIIRPDGAIRWVESRGHPIYDEEGRCIRMMGLILDVTERKQSEQALQSTMAELHHLKEIAEAENIYLREEVSRVHRFGKIVGRSEAILSVLKQAEQVAPTNTTALILGETGTGKELLARAVHACSKRNERALVTVNCAALPASLIESELFGHERGAFTGAAGKRIGRFEFADRATIFLDEIGELPLELQAKLLRVLQDGEFERLGSSKTIKVDVRVIAATNRDLRRAIQERKFREDLYYRLNVYPIHIPPLRERKEDIGPLAMEFIVEAGQKLGRSFDPISRDVLAQLQAYDWPGNARELQNVIERAALASPGRMVRLPEHWPPGYLEERHHPASPSCEEENQFARFASLEDLERNHVLRVLKQTRWRIEGTHGAAEILKINPSTLRSRMNKLGIRRFETISARERQPVQ